MANLETSLHFVCGATTIVGNLSDDDEEYKEFIKKTVEWKSRGSQPVFISLSERQYGFPENYPEEIKKDWHDFLVDLGFRPVYGWLNSLHKKGTRIYVLEPPALKVESTRSFKTNKPKWKRR